MPTQLHRHLSPDERSRLEDAYRRVKDELLSARSPAGHWEGELSTSALSTATAVMALLQVSWNGGHPKVSSEQLQALACGGLEWLLVHQNADGGWGDTVKSRSNISTTMLCHAVLIYGERHGISGDAQRVTKSISAAEAYIREAGGTAAMIARYGRDRTFSVPILTHCALAGLVEWSDVPALPFELSCLPAHFYKTVRLPVVSYALPALIAIGQVRHHFVPSRNPVMRHIRNRAVEPSLRVLQSIQPTNGGFLEAAPLTSFVTMSLAACGLALHPVAVKGVQFLVDSVRPDGSWPIDTNLATWVTTLSVNALQDDLPDAAAPVLLHWLLDQQMRTVHPYTNADPGGWAWTPLPGGVPDADDTPGAMIALCQLAEQQTALELELPEVTEIGIQDSFVRFNGAVPRLSEMTAVSESLQLAADWLVSLQNRDGGFPTFCRGWGRFPFDRSSPDITAHVLRGLVATLDFLGDMPSIRCDTYRRAIDAGFDFLRRVQRPDGSWLPLWFGNEAADDDINPTYGTARVLMAWRDCVPAEGTRDGSHPAQRGFHWLRENQNPDGGWGAGPGTPSSVEETALATEALLEDPQAVENVRRGLNWLLDRIDSGGIGEPAPIGFYFARLWYFERLYPLIFAVSCLGRASRQVSTPSPRRFEDGVESPFVERERAC